MAHRVQEPAWPQVLLHDVARRDRRHKLQRRSPEDPPPGISRGPPWPPGHRLFNQPDAAHGRNQDRKSSESGSLFISEFEAVQANCYSE